MRQLCGGLASAFSNIVLVETYFFVVKWEKDAHRRAPLAYPWRE